MIDYARITVKAGDGGAGSGSFYHIKGKRHGKADGGDGGRGGNAYFEATGDLNTLDPFRYVKEYKAEDGKAGSSNRRRGAEGVDLVIRVPVGTVITISNIKYQKSNIYDLVESQQKILIARGGEGGRGNCHIRDEFGRKPRVGEKGEDGEVKDLTLELKLIADVGLIGLPNAGKSTLLAKLTAARPKIASYPFTTLEPNLGVITFSGPVTRKSSLVLADIPGLIEGASEGRGLGDLFLRHIERTRILVHLIDASAASDKWQDYQTVRGELKAYSKDLLAKKELIVLTKIDLVDQEKLSGIRQLFKSKRKKIMAISSVTGHGLEQLVLAIFKLTGGKN